MEPGSERRVHERAPQGAAAGFTVSYEVRPGISQTVQAKLIDIHEAGCGLELGLELPVGMPVTVQGAITDDGTPIAARAYVSWTKVTDNRTFRIGLQFAEPVQVPKQRKAAQSGSPPPVAPKHLETDDLYELLQVSPNADADTIHRVYRLLAQRYHPDNAETANPAAFRRVTEAFKTLSDPERRAGYDAQHKEVLERRWRIFDQHKAVQGVGGEKAKRDGVLGLLYTKRLNQPDAPGMAMQEFEQLLGVPREHLEFTLWYLREHGFINRTDNGRVSITVKGVDQAEREENAWIQPQLALLEPATAPSSF